MYDDRNIEIGDATLVVHRDREERDVNAPARWVVDDVLGADGQTLSDGEVLELARELTSFDGENLEDALEALLAFALDDTRELVALDVDAPAPIELDTVELPIDFDVTPTAWDELLSADPEAPATYALTAEDVDAFEQEQRAHDTLNAIAS